MGIQQILKSIFLAVLISGGFLLFIRWFERSNLYFPFPAIEVEPHDRGLEFEEHYFYTPDGERLHGWYLPNREEVKYTLIYFHGNAGNISHRLQKIEVLLRSGVNVFIFDYRGYGRSTGSPDEEGTYIDAMAAYKFIKNSKGLSGEEIIFYGKSLGGTIASHLATEVEVAGVYLNSTFSSVLDMAREILPFLPLKHILTYEYNALEKIGNIGSPILISHSPDDRIVPFSQGKALFEAATEPKIFCETIGGHNETTPREMEKVAECLKRLIDLIGTEGT